GRGAPVEERAGKVGGKREGRGGIRKHVRRRTSRDDSQHARIGGSRRVEALAELQTVLVHIPTRERVLLADGSDGGQAQTVLGKGRAAGEYDTRHDGQSDPPLQFQSRHWFHLHVGRVV